MKVFIREFDILPPIVDSEKIKFTKSYKGSFRMSKRSPKLVEEKLEVVHLLLNQEQSVGQLSKQCQVSKQTIQS